VNQPTGRQWTLTILAPCPWLTANQLNNRHNRYSRSTLTKEWRTIAATLAGVGGLPTGLDYIAVDGLARFRGRPPVRDRDNLRPTLKAVIDGLGPARVWTRKGTTYRSPGHGLIPDDSDKYLARSDIHIGDPLPTVTRPDHPGLLILTITELTR
jgi:hypothetical protein